MEALPAVGPLMSTRVGVQEQVVPALPGLRESSKVRGAGGGAGGLQGVGFCGSQGQVGLNMAVAWPVWDLGLQGVGFCGNQMPGLEMTAEHGRHGTWL